jgi:hypothetical protein
LQDGPLGRGCKAWLSGVLGRSCARAHVAPCVRRSEATDRRRRRRSPPLFAALWELSRRAEPPRGASG